MSESADSPLCLRAGSLRAAFYPDALFLRYVELGGVEALRGVYWALRDQNWGTPQPKVVVTSQSIQSDSFEITLEAIWNQEGIRFAATGELTGTEEGEIRYSFSGRAQSDFLRNRLGFVVLHGAQLAGQKVRVTHENGEVEESAFPAAISPHQPFFSLREIQHEVISGYGLSVRMEGDVFEMEDQRNWTDASFKTYCTPLEKPFPVLLREGDVVEQAVTLRASVEHGGKTKSCHAPDDSIRMVANGGNETFKLPALGLEKAWGDKEPLSEREIAFLRGLKLNHLRVEIRFAHPGWETDLEAGIRLARELGVSLELPLFLSEGCEDGLMSLLQRLSGDSVLVCQWLILHEEDMVPTLKWIRYAAQRIEESGLAGRVATGTNANFTELNRNAPEAGPYQALCYAINPQVHAFDDLSLVETLSMQGETLRNARQLGRDEVSSVISPITLTQRYNPVARSEGNTFAYSEATDPRQRTRFGAVWTAGSILHCAVGGAETATYFKTRGETGVMKTGAKSEDDLYPLYHIFQYFGEAGDVLIQLLASSHPFKVDAFLLNYTDRIEYLILNYTEEKQRIRLELDSSKGLPNAACDLIDGSEATLETDLNRSGAILSCPGRSILRLIQRN